jgi:hypothetical protein
MPCGPDILPTVLSVELIVYDADPKDGAFELDASRHSVADQP